MNLQRIFESRLAEPGTILPLASILAVAGPVLIVSAGIWDAVSHLQKEPEFFWSTPHVIVYAGVAVSAAGAALGGTLLARGRAKGSLRTGLWLLVAGSALQMAAGFGDSISHDIYGIDGLISWSHQPLEIGLLAGSLGGVIVIKNREHTMLRHALPPSIIAFLFFALWLAFNAALAFGHTIQCIPVYEIFSSGCAIL